MGRAIEELALKKNHEIVLTVASKDEIQFTTENLQQADVAIEFSNQYSAPANIRMCLDAGVPVVSGTTGWLNQLNEIKEYCFEKNGSFLYASNFSVGVNLFFEVNSYLANIMKSHPEYDVLIEEIHHTQKLDTPSGTAISLAEQIISAGLQKENWVNHASDNGTDLQILSERTDPVPGTHKVKYFSSIDDIEMIHTAHNRKGFASGALLAAEYIQNKKGIFTMKDVLDSL